MLLIYLTKYLSTIEPKTKNKKTKNYILFHDNEIQTVLFLIIIIIIIFFIKIKIKIKVKGCKETVILEAVVATFASDEKLPLYFYT